MDDAALKGQRERLEMCGRAGWGETWQTQMARALGVDDSLVRRWLNGDRAVPAARWEQIVEILKARRCQIDVAVAVMTDKPVIL